MSELFPNGVRIIAEVNSFFSFFGTEELMELLPKFLT